MIYIDGFFNKETGITTVIIQHMGEKFVGIAKLHPDDKNRSSVLVGGRYAEMRATIKALKYEKRILKQEYNIIKNFYTNCTQCKGYQIDSNMDKIFRKQLYKRQKRINEIIEDIALIQLALEKDILDRDKILAKIKND